jgi:hypothetical protein
MSANRHIEVTEPDAGAFEQERTATQWDCRRGASGERLWHGIDIGAANRVATFLLHESG